jgi:tRNA-dihydrouridine synthase B
VTYPVNLIQGPLAGISCAPFRYLTWQHSQPAFTCTEMISCKTLIHQSDKTKQRYIEKHPNEGPTCFQLSTNDPLELTLATKIVTDGGADLIDLNCGCPVKKIRNKGAGSRLLTDPKKLYHLIYAMKMNTNVPVSIKIRVEGQSSEKFHQDLVKVISEAGTDFITVHGRHWTEHYETSCHYEDIQFFVNALKIPVIGNGDIRCVESLKKMFSTGCAGAMIGRAGVGQPWLIKKLIAELNQQPFLEPTLDEMGEMFLHHTAGLIKFLQNEKLAILQARKFSKYYARTLSLKNEFSHAVNDCDNFLALQDLTCDFFKTPQLK